MTERKLNYYAFYPGDFRKDTQHLTRDERHAFRDLLDEIFISEQKTCSLPDDDYELARIVGRSESEWKEMRRALIDGKRAMFRKSGKRIYSKRLREEIAKAKGKSKQAKDAAAQRTHSGRIADVDRTMIGRSTNKNKSKSKKNPSDSKREKKKTPPTVGVQRGAAIVDELRTLGSKVGKAALKLAERWGESPGEAAVLKAIADNRDSILAADHPTQYLGAIVRNLGKATGRRGPDDVTLPPKTRKDALLDLIDEYRVQAGPRPQNGDRAAWDEDFRSRFGFYPEAWNDGLVTDEDIEAALGVTV